MLLDATSLHDQSALAEFCRSGSHEFVGQYPEERRRIYRSKVFGIIREALTTAYPITVKVLGEERWQRLVVDFFSQHAAQTPYYWRMPRELCDFVKNADLAARWTLPYLDDLLLFEWLEVEVFRMEDSPVPPYTPEGSVLEHPLVLNPEHRLTQFSYPVYKMSARILEGHRGSYFLLTYRHPKTLSVHFVELSRLHTLMLEVLKQGAFPGRDILQFAAEQLMITMSEDLENRVMLFLEGLIRQGVLLGYEPA